MDQYKDGNVINPSSILIASIENSKQSVVNVSPNFNTLVAAHEFIMSFYFLRKRKVTGTEKVYCENLLRAHNITIGECPISCIYVGPTHIASME